MDSGWAVLLGALLGGFIAWATSYWTEVRREKRIARNCAVGAASEIEAAIHLLEAMGWRKGVRDYEIMAQQGHVQRLSIHATDQYLPFTREAFKEAGAMDQRLSLLLARLVMLEASILGDLRRLAQFPIDDPDGLLESSNPDAAAEMYGRLGLRLDNVIEVGNQAVKRVRELYPA